MRGNDMRVLAKAGDTCSRQLRLPAPTFFGAAFFLRVSEVQDIIDVFRRKVGRS